MNDELLNLIREYAKKYGIDPAIVYGICQTESNFDQYACRYEPDYQYIENTAIHKPASSTHQTERFFQKCSWGVMQVMGGVFRQYQYRGWLSKIPENLHIQLDYGCRHLSSKINRYGLDRGILSYNSGSPVKRNGRYINEKYLEKVLKYSREYPKKFCELMKGVL